MIRLQNGTAGELQFDEAEEAAAFVKLLQEQTSDDDQAFDEMIAEEIETNPPDEKAPREEFRRSLILKALDMRGKASLELVVSLYQTKLTDETRERCRREFPSSHRSVVPVIVHSPRVLSLEVPDPSTAVISQEDEWVIARLEYPLVLRDVHPETLQSLCRHWESLISRSSVRFKYLFEGWV